MKKWLIVWIFLLMAAPAWAVAAGGSVGSLGLSTDGGLTEWGTSAALRTAPTLTPSSATIAFSADSNDARPVPLTSWDLLPPLLSVWRAYWEAVRS